MNERRSVVRLWLGLLAVVVLVLVLRREVVLALAALTGGRHGVDLALGLLVGGSTGAGLLVLTLFPALADPARPVRRRASLVCLTAAVVLTLLVSPMLGRSGQSSASTEQLLRQELPGYLEGWLGGLGLTMLIVLVLAGAARRRQRRAGLTGPFELIPSAAGRPPRPPAPGGPGRRGP